MATPQHSPRARGYDSWLGYWHHSNDYWTLKADDSRCGTQSMKDLWRLNDTVDAPAHDLDNGPSCKQSNQAPAGERCVYESILLTDEVKRIISNHDVKTPLFLLWAMHLVHMPLQAPQAYLDKFSFVDNKNRRLMKAMTNYLDTQLGEVISLLKSTGIWENALLVFHSDNGGEMLDQSCGGNNWPLRGGKFSNWEGGIRVNAFVNGGVLPTQRRGQRETGYMTGWDWFATYCAIAGVDPVDKKAAKAGLHPVTSLNMWDLISGVNETSPRSEIIIGDTNAIRANGDGQTLVGGLIQGHNKLVLGDPDRAFLMGQNVRAGPFWPNETSRLIPVTVLKECGRTHRTGCLFDIHKDPYEENNLANIPEFKELFNSMLARVDELQAGVYSPVRGDVNPKACDMAHGKYDGFWGPFLNV